MLFVTRMCYCYRRESASVTCSIVRYKRHFDMLHRLGVDHACHRQTTVNREWVCFAQVPLDNAVILTNVHECCHK